MSNTPSSTRQQFAVKQHPPSSPDSDYRGKQPPPTISVEALIPYAKTSVQLENLQAIIEHGSASAAADALGRDRSNVKRSLRRAKDAAALAGYSPEHDMTHQVPDPYVVKGTSTLYDREGNPQMQWVKTALDQDRKIEVIHDAVRAISEDVPRIAPVSPPSASVSELMTVYPMGDPHFGMYSWAAETGADFNLEIAERDLYAAVDYLVNVSPASRVGVLLNLGDFFHAENMAGITTRSGHVLDMDTRFPRMLDVGFRALRRCITRMLEKHEEVHVVNVPGNHDEVLAFALNTMFRNLYENEPRIIVHDEPTQRHYVRHGKVFIGAHHGHRTKDKELPILMATERPEDWGETRHRYFFRGHHHHDLRIEYTGCIVEQVRTLAAGDSYAVGSGFLSGRDMKAITYHAEYGEQSRIICGIDLLRGTSPSA